ncbi:lipid phosphate phosphatase, putative [Entamoeba histolytica HM-1:IMSS-B]|uniref:Lipid phosphate phosphatase, putative n=6 Tax=Entamoeba histolytica TaxID=5759 RepID=C4LXK2_ENTH1|nr:lipid phosphate phosphatase, putative [Entamoeba histolytica HM-1:IMSS]EMD44714.1 lipid phosphate phosphatase, putative [Entamoeba histolytica KU27]EMH74163.1 lipid phosphate phosphatase, putative [Entamoeba histolytica HM-1:IMSS-B]EMS12488.1 lipid phosphate phosphatase [Entamoeba histolytica HM-3:IMSS]ENY63930.1 lipid phosphate phosphatase, putative [Entamoeba histolytica HM-1:IMSS-A]GAT93484.1 lipid phosphate phosphatase putative [Entamoeba histolytica]|eukprot:XP_656687.1 lipid phosphate phosphatase, putative [Entamoeba histolytica HM-1:IMSS]
MNQTGIIENSKRFINEYKSDIGLYLILIIINNLVGFIPTHQEIPYKEDPNYMFSKLNDVIPRTMNVIINFYIPICVIAIISIYQKNIEKGLTVLIPFLNSEMIVGIIIQLLKRYSGKPRPFYNTYCIEHYKPTCNHSFPSGHTAYAFQGQVFLSLILLEFISKYKQSNNLIVQFIVFLPCVWAFVVGLTRFYDHHHAISDILAGGIIGAFIAFTTYYVYKNKVSKKKELTDEELFAIEFE